MEKCRTVVVQLVDAVIITSGGSAGLNRLREVAFSETVIQCKRSLLDGVAGAVPRISFEAPGHVEMLTLAARPR